MSCAAQQQPGLGLRIRNDLARSPPPWHLGGAYGEVALNVVQRTGADKILGLGVCHGDVLKIGNEWGGHVLNMGLFSSSFKRPQHPNDL